MVSIAINVLLCLVSFFTFLPLIRWEHYSIRLWDYPRKQLLVGILFGLVVKLIFSEIESSFSLIAIGSSLVAIGFLVYKIARYTPLANTQLKSTKAAVKQLSLLIGNVEMKNDKFDKMLNEILKKQADLVMLVETNKKWQDALKIVEKDYAYCHHLPLDNTYGVLIYSKIKLENAEFKYLVNDEIPSFHTTFEIQGKQIRFYGLHPEPPFPTQSKDTVERDAEILMVGRAIEKIQEPVIVAGDLNDVAWSYTTELFQKISGLLDPRIGRGFFSTFHARKAWARWPLDHVFCSEHFHLVKMERLGYIGSDHFPIYLELSLVGGEEENETHEKVDQEERKFVNAKIDMV